MQLCANSLEQASRRVWSVMKGEPPNFGRSVFNEPLETWVCVGTPCEQAGTVVGTGFILGFPIGARKIPGADAAFQLFQLKAEPQTVNGGERVGLIRKLNMGRSKNEFLSSF